MPVNIRVHEILPINLLLSKDSSESLAGASPYALRATLAGLHPTPQQGASPLHLQLEGLRPSRCALHPTLAAGQRGRVSPAPVGVAYGAETAQGARGYALRAPYPRASPCGTARTPCTFIAAVAMQLQLIGHDEVSRFAARRPRSGLALTRIAVADAGAPEGPTNGRPLLPRGERKRGCGGTVFPHLGAAGAEPPQTSPKGPGKCVPHFSTGLCSVDSR